MTDYPSILEEHRETSCPRTLSFSGPGQSQGVTAVVVVVAGHVPSFSRMTPILTLNI